MHAIHCWQTKGQLTLFHSGKNLCDTWFFRKLPGTKTCCSNLVPEHLQPLFLCECLLTDANFCELPACSRTGSHFTLSRGRRTIPSQHPVRNLALTSSTVCPGGQLTTLENQRGGKQGKLRAPWLSVLLSCSASSEGEDDTQYQLSQGAETTLHQLPAAAWEHAPSRGRRQRGWPARNCSVH